MPSPAAHPYNLLSTVGRRDRGGRTLSGIEVGLLIFLILYVPLVTFLYGRQGRWSGALGWSLFVAGVAGLAVGAAARFPWGGLALSAAAAMGLLLVLLDLAARPRRR